MPSPSSIPYADIESFRRRDAARAELVEIIGGIMDKREGEPPVEAEDRDLVDVLMSIKDDDGNGQFSADIVTGMFISMMFAGHHTTSTTASWLIIELLRNPDVMARVIDEMDALAEAGGGTITYQDLREVPWLESSIKETLRLHPPLILLLRLVMEPFDVEGFHIPAGKLVGASPAVSNRLPEAFADARPLRPGALHRAPPGRPGQPVELDPVRRRPSPLRRRGLRADAAQVHLLRAAA